MERLKFENSRNYKGIVESVYVSDGEVVKVGQLLAKISTQVESFEITSPIEGIVKNVYVIESLIVTNGDIIFDIVSSSEQTMEPTLDFTSGTEIFNADNIQIGMETKNIFPTDKFMSENENFKKGDEFLKANFDSNVEETSRNFENAENKTVKSEDMHTFKNEFLNKYDESINERVDSVNSNVEPLTISDSITEELSLWELNEKKHESSFTDEFNKNLENNQTRKDKNDNVSIKDLELNNQSVSHVNEEELLSQIAHEIKRLNKALEEKESDSNKKTSHVITVDESQSNYLVDRDEKDRKNEFLNKKLEDLMLSDKNSMEKLESLISNNDLLSEEVRLLKLENEKLNEKLQLIEKSFSLSSKNNETTKKFKMSFEVDITALMTIYTLMQEPYLKKGIELSLCTFYLKAFNMVSEKFNLLDVNKNTISLGTIDEKGLNFNNLAFDSKIPLDTLANIMSEKVSQSNDSKLVMFELSNNSAEYVNLNLENPLDILLVVGEPRSKVKEDMILSNIVTVSFEFDLDILTSSVALNFAKEFNYIIGNPGFII